MNEERTYVAIDLKSFYASVECVERKREPLTTNLVVADESRTEKTICLAVSPSLKSYGISGRARLFEVVQQVRQINALPAQKGFDQAVAYINDHYTEDISSASLSERFGYDESYFCRKFKKQTGLTVMKYIQILRIEKARKLLTETELSIQAISRQCGFADTAYFTNRFKSICHMTPTQLRETAQHK